MGLGEGRAVGSLDFSAIRGGGSLWTNSYMNSYCLNGIH